MTLNLADAWCPVPFIKREQNLVSNFVDIDFAIKLNDKKSRRFDLSEAIFKCE